MSPPTASDTDRVSKPVASHFRYILKLLIVFDYLKIKVVDYIDVPGPAAVREYRQQPCQRRWYVSQQHPQQDLGFPRRTLQASHRASWCQLLFRNLSPGTRNLLRNSFFELHFHQSNLYQTGLYHAEYSWTSPYMWGDCGLTTPRNEALPRAVACMPSQAGLPALRGLLAQFLETLRERHLLMDEKLPQCFASCVHKAHLK
ncbi:hypothetical protein Q5P01_009376 [Channa striata]|uniref:Uncharacterized protein n=1 Tax=Channa striata TaxID=64152 RepID=A0AA88STJ4_CHASR|nr:hypothetical protein Q5P01_009376 [Channa striata]